MYWLHTWLSLHIIYIAIFFNALLTRCMFPDNLKQSFVIPINKSGNRENVTNYRPVTIQPVLAKMFESLVLVRLSFFMKHLIVPEQHVFL